jgi:hypothetical protein
MDCRAVQRAHSQAEPSIMDSPDVKEESSSLMEERRRNPRQRLGRIATIKLGVGIPPRFVLVTNTSVEGVRLQLNGIDVIDMFVLLFHGAGGAARDGTYKVVWRQGQEVGAKFISPLTQNT